MHKCINCYKDDVMAKFAGAIGVLTQSEISGPVHVAINEQPVNPQIILKFENIGTFAPTQITEMLSDCHRISSRSTAQVPG